MLRVGMVGAGFMAKMHAECYRWMPEAEVVAVAEVRPEAASEFAGKFKCKAYPSVEAMLAEAEVEVIDVCTPTDNHPAAVLAAAKAKKHILCEKPIALTLQEAEAMIDACRTAKVKFMVGHVLRFWPECQVIREIVASGKLGEAQWATARRFSFAPDWSVVRWHLEPMKSGGAVLDLHIHDLDYFAWLLGPPRQVSARGFAGPRGGLDTVFTTMSGHARGAAVSHAEASFLLPPSFAFTSSMVVGMEKGAVSFETGREPTLLVYEEGKEPYSPALPPPSLPVDVQVGGNISDLGGYFFEIRYFVDCVLEDKEPSVVTPQEAKKAVGLCLAARKSAETGEAVEVA